MKQLLFFSFILLFSQVYNACTSYQSEQKCLESKEGCCWLSSKFKGTPFNYCTENYRYASENTYLETMYNNLEFTDVKVRCSNIVNNCLDVDIDYDDYDYEDNDPRSEQNKKTFQQKCISSENDCCLLTYKYEYNNIPGYSAPLEESICMANSYGTEKAYSSALNMNEYSMSSYGEESVKMSVKAKCKTNTPNFYSTCFEANNQNSCLKANSNCCWMKIQEKIGYGGDVTTINVANCQYNFFTTASLYKDYAKIASNFISDYLDIEVKYDVTCNQHEYALFGGSGVVVKDGSDPNISYDLETKNEIGTAPISKIDIDSGMNISFNIILYILLGLLFF